MKTFTFNTNKYGKELLIDLGRFEETPVFHFENTPHALDFYEILFFSKAKGELRLDTRKIPLHNNLVVYSTPYQRRSWNVKREDIKGYFLIFSKHYFELFFSDKLFAHKLQFFHNYRTPPFLCETKESFWKNDYAFQRIEAELQDLKEDSNNYIQVFLLLILMEHNRRYSNRYGINLQKKWNQEPYAIKKKLEEQIRHNLKVDDLARSLGISRITLNKKVKDRFGVTAAQFIKERRLVEIERELLFSTKNISEIAYELNFSEAHHLIRFFKKHKNQTPAEFRVTYQNGY